MPVDKPKGLEGLKGLGSLSKAEHDNFINRNRDLISKHHYDPVYINKLYANKQFIDAFGVDQFKATPNSKMRNFLLKEFIVDREASKYSPYDTKGVRDNNRGFGEYWEKFQDLSTEGKLKVMQSDWLTPSEFNNKWNNYVKKGQERDNNMTSFISNLASARHMGMAIGSEGMRQDKYGETQRKLMLDSNQKIFDKIYNDDADLAAKEQAPLVTQYYNELLSLTDEQIRKNFIKAITPGGFIYKDGRSNLGIGPYAAYYGNGKQNEIKDEMRDFSIDKMREVLAKKKAYETTMSPIMAKTALENDAKRYITEHQTKFGKFLKFNNDLAISAMSYTADKLNSVGEIYRGVQDMASSKKPIVYVDNENNILDPNKVKLFRDKDGSLRYIDKNSKAHSVHKIQVDYTTLHSLGKNEDGSDIEGAFGTDWMTLNPQYWTRAEQFGTLDENEQKQYEKIGYSPYKVMYNPNDESDLWYEAFKMASFGIADGFAQVIPFGVGAGFGALSKANKVGKVVRGFSNIMSKANKLLTAETGTGRVIQGLSGAGGIAYAYNRGAFPETLQQNIENMEDRINNKVRNDIYNRYNTDKEYKAEIDKQIDSLTAYYKEDYFKKVKTEGAAKPVDMQVTEKILRAKAQDYILAKELQKNIEDFKRTQEYADLQQRAMDGAGDAAFNTYWTEALKYSFVNTMGHRKFLYQNPAGVARKLSQSLKGLKEITTSAGRKRLVTETSKFLTRGDKMKQLGKTAVSQVWGGAWTNGTDDMQVDAAERINEDSFNRYLNAWESGDAMASTYGFADGLYSYIKGLQNSLGQETTWNAALVGGVGSTVNFTPNFANIASLFTKQGRQFYKDNFRRSIKRNDETGEVLKNDDGSVKYNTYGKFHDPIGQLNFFLQNGILNTYYGKKQAEKDLQSHADYVNDLLDSYNDFTDIEHLIASNIASENLDGKGDEKTSDFLKALFAVRTLNNLAKSDKDPTTMSSVVQKAKDLITRASELNNEDGSSPFSEEEVSNLLSQYYAQNKGLEQSDINNQKALYNIAQNAQKLQEALQAFDNAEKEISKLEKNYGIEIDHQVKTKMMLDQALGKHWSERKEKMQSEINDTSSKEAVTDPSIMIATVGGRKNAKALVKVYDKQQAEMEKDLKEQKEKTTKFQKEYEDAVKATKEAQDKNDSDALLAATQVEKEAQAKYENSRQTEKFMQDIIQMTVRKRASLQNTTEEGHIEDNEISLSSAKEELAKSKKELASLKKEREKLLEKDGTPQKEHKDKAEELDDKIEAFEEVVKAKQETVDKYTERVLTADEVFNLDPVTRARMMREENRSLYSEEQQREIEKLEERLLIKDADALQKIQDIGLLTQRIHSVQDAYTRMAKNPRAAAYEVENERRIATGSAARLINQRNAETLADFMNNMSELLKKYPDISQADKEQYIYRELRKYNSYFLDIIDSDNLMPDYAKQVNDAKEWAKVVEDIDAIIMSSEKTDKEKAALRKNIDDVLDNVDTKEQIMSAFEKVIDDVDNPNAIKDFEFILSNMEKLDYQRDATILENRKERLEREAKQKEKKEAEQKRVEEATKAAAEKDAEKKKAEEESKKKATEKEPIVSDENFDADNAQDVKLDLDEKGTEDTSSTSSEKPSNVTEDKDYVYIRSENIEEQAKDEQFDDKKIEMHTTDSSEDADTQNILGEQNTDTSPVYISGTAMPEFEYSPLAEDGIIKRKKGRTPGDKMDHYFDWMKAAGIKLQNIIDQELARILIRNPHAKVKFMTVKQDFNATHDDVMNNHLMLVLDYDNSINKGITSIHNDNNGGVIESDGKKYLIIGVVGYGSNNIEKRALYDILFSNNPKGKTGYGLIRRKRGKFFKEHPTERFYVDKDLSTEIVPNYPVPGYIVRQMEHDAEPKFRSIMELLTDDSRNPLHLTLEDMAWGIQELSNFVTINASGKAMSPQDVTGNLGSAFALIPASNGKLLPIYLKVLKYAEMREGTLKSKIDNILQDATSPNYEKRYNAVIELSKILYFNKEGDYILLRKNKNEISLVHDGKVFKTFILDSSFDRTEFISAFNDMNPRVNVTVKGLSSMNYLKELDEAGALMTDAAMLATAGSSYSIYGLDAEGNMIKPKVQENTTATTGNSDFRNKDRHLIIYNYQYYREADGVFYLDGKPVISDITNKHLSIIKKILDNSLTPVESKGVFDYYILSSGEHPKAVKINRNTKEVKEATEEQSKELIKRVEEKRDKERRELMAEKVLRKTQEEGIVPTGGVGVELDVEADFTVDPETGEIISSSTNTDTTDIKDEVNTEDKVEDKDKASISETQSSSSKYIPSTGSSLPKDSTQTFQMLISKFKYQTKVISLIKKKWNDAPSDIADLEKLLKEKGIEVENIGTSEEAIKTWIKTIEDCR